MGRSAGSRVADQRFRKVRPGAGSDYYAAEAAGLQWISVPGGPPVPEVFSIRGAALELERIHETSPSPAAAVRFGLELAALHRSGADSFGCPPPGAPASGWIANVPMPYGEFETFGRMYAELRIRPYLRLCRDAEAFDTTGHRIFETLVDALIAEDPRLVGPVEPPARLHGDLWSGNLLWAPDRIGSSAVWLVDPAAHGGHRETDLAMLSLFGAPQFDRIIEAYDSAYPLPVDWKQRMPLHQVYPLLVHTIMFGGGYADQAIIAATRALALTGITPGP